MITLVELFNEALATIGGGSAGEEIIPEDELKEMAENRKEDNKCEFIKASEWMNDDALWPTAPEARAIK